MKNLLFSFLLGFCTVLALQYVEAVVEGETSPNLGITFMASNENQPHLTFNEMVSILDGLVMPTVTIYPADPDPDVNAPEEGDMFIVPVDATGDWDGEDNNLALYINNSWVFFTPKNGWNVYYNISTGGITDELYSMALQYNGQTGEWGVCNYYQVQRGVFGVNSDYSTNAKIAIGYDSEEISIPDTYLPLISTYGQSTTLPFFYFGVDDNERFLFSLQDEDNVSGFSVDALLNKVNLSSYSLYMDEQIGTPSDPAIGSSVIWVDSNGDLKMKINHGGVTKTATIVDFSAL